MHHGHKVYHFCSTSPNSNIDINITFCTLQAHRPDGSVAIAEYTLHANNKTYSSHNLFIMQWSQSILPLWLALYLGYWPMYTYKRKSAFTTWSQCSDLHKYLPLLVPDDGRLYNDHCQEDHHCCNGYSCHCPSSCALSGCGFSWELNIYTVTAFVTSMCTTLEVHYLWLG